MTNEELLAKIKSEIERRKSLLTQHSKLTYDLILETFIKEYDDLLSFLSTLESEKTISPWKKIHTYTEEIHEGDMEKMLLELSVGKGEKRTKIALPDRIVDFLESEKPIDLDELMKEAQRYYSDNFEYLSSDQPTLSILTNIARNFAQWGAERQKEQDDRLVDIIYQQGIEKGKDDIRKTLKRKEKK